MRLLWLVMAVVSSPGMVVCALASMKKVYGGLRWLQCGVKGVEQ